MSRLEGWLRPRRDGFADVALALAIAALYVALLLGSVESLGYARDEGFYFDAARAYQRWFELLWRDPARAMVEVDRYWRHNHEHPALIKSLFALSHAFLYERWGLFAMEGTSFRFPAMLLSGLGVGLVYLWGARARGRLCGLVAAGSLAAMPRFFFHAHLACFDVPVVTLWTLCAYCHWRHLERGGWLRALGVGASFALALDSKHNSWFLPVVIVAHGALSELPGVARGIDPGKLRRRLGWSLLSMATVGPLLFYALWPWLWHDTFARLGEYARFHLHHVYYNMEYLGVTYFEPPMPRSYAFVMTLATVPLTTLALFAIGLALALGGLRSRARGRPGAGAPDAGTEVLWIVALAVQYAAWLRPGTPIFGGTKHWLTAYPFLVLLAGSGARWLARRARAGLRSTDGALRVRAVVVALAMAAVGVPAVQAWHAHPWGLASYNVAVGGAPGAATLGLNRGFWGYTTGAVADYLNAAPPRARVFLHDTAWPSWDMLVRDGRVRRDLRPVASVAGSDVALYHHEQHMLGVDYQAWVACGPAPDHIAGLDGVPVIWVYRCGPGP